MNEDTPDQERYTDTRTNEELFHAALLETDDEIAWIAIGELYQRRSRDVFEHACTLCTSANTHERRVGVNILSQLGAPNYLFPTETLTLLLNMLTQEQESVVLEALAVALGYRHDPRAMEALVRLKQHPDEGVRFGVAFSLSSYEEEPAILALLELSRDPDAHVRDWATFGLGSQMKIDTPAVREALVERLTDNDESVRGEALVGLALRHDPRMIEPLLNDLEDGWLKNKITDEATATRERLYPLLLQMREAWTGNKSNTSYKQLEEAIEKCQLV